MRRLNWKIGSTQRLLTGIAVAGIAALLANVALGRLHAAGGAQAADDPCRVAHTSVAVAAADGASTDRQSAWSLYPAALDRRRWDDGLPGDLGELTSVAERKAIFVSLVLPMIHRVNQEILHHRRLVEIALVCSGDGRSLGRAFQAAIGRLHDRYRTEGDLASLRQRLDIVPPSLAIAQAAIESGWGTSRFAVHGNALFGQRTTNRDRGIRPANLPPTTPVRVAYFDHLMASVRSYVHNLNTHPAYRHFRDRRAALRRNGDEPDGLALAGTLIAYSSRGPAYVRDVKSIIQANRLAVFDSAEGMASPGSPASGSDT